MEELFFRSNGNTGLLPHLINKIEEAARYVLWLFHWIYVFNLDVYMQCFVIDYHRFKIIRTFPQTYSFLFCPLLPFDPMSFLRAAVVMGQSGRSVLCCHQLSTVAIGNLANEACDAEIKITIYVVYLFYSCVNIKFHAGCPY